MTPPINEITIAGATVDLGVVEYQVSISHGRNDVTAQPEASDASIIVRGSTGVDAEIADTVTIEAYGAPRFTGQITDIGITHLPSPAGNPVAVTQITAMGNLSKLGLIEVGAAGYPEQDVQDRAQAILADVGLPSLNNTRPGITLEAQPPTDFAPTAYDALQDLARQIGATFSDRPNGFISFESYGLRGIVYQEGAWGGQQFPWDNYDPALEWGDLPTGTTVPEQAYFVPSAGVTFTPSWSAQLQPVINTVNVSYGSNDPQDTVTASDSGSIAAYGRREFTLETQIKSSLDATDRAQSIITAQAVPLYQLEAISVLVHLLGSTDRDELLALVEGRRVIVSDLPQPGPFTQFQGIVEGWAETYTPGQHILTLSISDPRYSFQVATWAEVDPALEWGDVDPAVQWYNVITPEDLAA
jgi:hypothetical protein